MSWTCAKCERDLPWNDFRHYCKHVSLDTVFEGRSDELVLVFDKILAEVADWPKVLISTTPNCIVFYRRTGFLVAESVSVFPSYDACLLSPALV